ncbi:MAG: hypothetical protein AMS16_02885 [Planctomycetes bacterium DG_58]|nr:MAG: hypothetical protein AMS16_02885 [Planctomycetes bacterium DG_58]KPL03350.1 MAG: hypothetical protein AMK75_01560 [Planctomycetes bacterium SM23_65]
MKVPREDLLHVSLPDAENLLHLVHRKYFQHVYSMPKDGSPAEVLTKQVKRLARICNMDLIGVTSSRPFDEDIQRVDEIIEDLTKMGRDNEARRLGFRKRALVPTSIWDEAKSIIVAAQPYAPPVKCSFDKKEYGRMAAVYVRDYYALIDSKIDMLGRFIETMGYRVLRGYARDGEGFSELTPMDHRRGCLMVRPVARRAGLGVIGKNTMLITKPYGSWVVLSFLMTDAPLIPDEPLKGWDPCRECDVCLKACPGNALFEGRKLIYEDCLNVTPSVEDHERLAKVGPYLWGCDVCQEVCPANRRTEHDSRESAPQAEEFLIPLRPLMEMGIMNPKVAVVLGNTENEEFVEPLTRLGLKHENPTVRRYARWALGRIRGRAGK